MIIIYNYTYYFALTKFALYDKLKMFFVTDGKSGAPHEAKNIYADRLGALFPYWIKCALLYFMSKGDNFMKKIGIVMGSDSDMPTVQKAIDTLKAFEVPYEVHIFSAHRTPVEAREFSVNARQNEFGAIIAAAGMAAHLAGAIAANTTLPVVGIPIKSGHLNGIDALLSTVQMPSGIPVATVAIDGAVNAALLCIQMLAIEDKDLANRLDAKRKADAQKVLDKNKAVEEQFN